MEDIKAVDTQHKYAIDTTQGETDTPRPLPSFPFSKASTKLLADQTTCQKIT